MEIIRLNLIYEITSEIISILWPCLPFSLSCFVTVETWKCYSLLLGDGWLWQQHGAEPDGVPQASSGLASFLISKWLHGSPAKEAQITASSACFKRQATWLLLTCQMSPLTSVFGVYNDVPCGCWKGKRHWITRGLSLFNCVLILLLI